MCALGLATTLAWSPASSPAHAGAVRQAAPAAIGRTIDDAFDAAYSLDFDRSLEMARAGVAAAPDSSAAHRTLASVLWLDIAFQRGAVTVDYYLTGLASSPVTLPKPPPDLVSEFTAELDRAIAIADRRLDANAKDLDARYDSGAAYALRASYQASVENRLWAAFRSAKHAFDAQEAVLDRAPGRADASVTVGIYRYLVSALSLPTRMFAYLMGFGGGKERGIAMIESALHGSDARADARVALLLIYSREGRHADALLQARALEAAYPRNRLFTLEAGAAAVRAGRAGEAEGILSRGLEALDHDPRPRIPGERSLWLYKRGLARMNQNHLDEAATDFTAALEAQPIGYVLGRTRLAIGQVADLRHQRDAAVEAYRAARTICRAAEDRTCASEADKLMDHPFRFKGGRR